MAEYGLPTWGSYLIFAIATIIIGAILGLVSRIVILLLFSNIKICFIYV